MSAKNPSLLNRIANLLRLQEIETPDELSWPAEDVLDPRLAVPHYGSADFGPAQYTPARMDKRVDQEVIKLWNPTPQRKYPRVLVYWHDDAKAWAVVWVHNPNNFTIENFYPDHESARRAGVAMAQQMTERLQRGEKEPG